MSHLINKIETKTASNTGNISLSISDIGNFTNTTDKIVNVNNSGQIVQSDPPAAGFKWVKCYHYRGLYTVWGGGSYLAAGGYYYLSWRKLSGTVSIDSSYATDLFNGSAHSTWANQIRLQAGTYLFNFSANFQITTANDALTLRLKNLTDDTLHGPTTHWGATQQSNTMFTYLTISSQKDFQWKILTLAGDPYFTRRDDLEHTHLNIWRIT